MDSVWIPVAVGALLLGAYQAMRPALGWRLWRVGGHVPAHHALSDPDVVRHRLFVRTLVMSGPALVGGPYLLVGALTIRDGWVAAFLAAGGAITAVAYGAAWATWLVRRRRVVPAAIVTALAYASSGLGIVTAALVWGYIIAANGSASAVMWAVVCNAWVVATLLHANEVRIVATWDRLCAARYQHA